MSTSNKKTKTGPSDLFIMNGMDYKTLIEIYNFKKMASKKVDKPTKKVDKSTKKQVIIKKLTVSIDGTVYKSLSEGMRFHGLLSPLDKNESKRSPSREAQYQAELKIWNKINNGIKKNDSYSYDGHEFKLIQ